MESCTTAKQAAVLPEACIVLAIAVLQGTGKCARTCSEWARKSLSRRRISGRPTRLASQMAARRSAHASHSASGASVQGHRCRVSPAHRSHSWSQSR